jgi:hypothetical protein
MTNNADEFTIDVFFVSDCSGCLSPQVTPGLVKASTFAPARTQA